MIELCPALDCRGPHVPDDPGHVVAYDHAPGCPIAQQEREQARADRRRHEKRGRLVFHRPATDAERAILAASGYPVPPSAPIFARVDWSSGHRCRSWTGVPLIAEDVSPNGEDVEREAEVTTW